MIQTIHGDLLQAKGLIIHGCNSQGVMASGVAKQIRETYPEAYNAYMKGIEEHCKGVTGYCTYYRHDNDTVIVNAVTQKYYGRDSTVTYVSYDAVRSCFREINKALSVFPNITDINFPKIGAGLGRGNWNVISKIIDEEIDERYYKTLWLIEES